MLEIKAIYTELGDEPLKKVVPHLYDDGSLRPVPCLGPVARDRPLNDQRKKIRNYYYGSNEEICMVSVDFLFLTLKKIYNGEKNRNSRVLKQIRWS